MKWAWVVDVGCGGVGSFLSSTKPPYTSPIYHIIGQQQQTCRLLTFYSIPPRHQQSARHEVKENKMVKHLCQHGRFSDSHSNAEIVVYKLWKTKAFVQFETIINGLVNSFCFIWILMKDGSTAIRNILILPTRRPSLYVRIWRLQTSDSDV